MEKFETIIIFLLIAPLVLSMIVILWFFLSLLIVKIWEYWKDNK